MPVRHFPRRSPPSPASPIGAPARRLRRAPPPRVGWTKGMAHREKLRRWNRSRERVFREGANRFEGEAVFLPHLARLRPKLLAKPCQCQTHPYLLVVVVCSQCSSYGDNFRKYGCVRGLAFWNSST
jgi:hypothetical protein